MAAMLPVHDVNLACQELYRYVKEYGAVGALVRPNYVNGRYWHSTYGDPLYAMLQDLGCRYAPTRGRAPIIRQSSPALARTASCGMSPAIDRNAIGAYRAHARRNLRIPSEA
jgi:hypothetical protein